MVNNIPEANSEKLSSKYLKMSKNFKIDICAKVCVIMDVESCTMTISEQYFFCHGLGVFALVFSVPCFLLSF